MKAIVFYILVILAVISGVVSYKTFNRNKPGWEIKDFIGLIICIILFIIGILVTIFM